MAAFPGCFLLVLLAVRVGARCCDDLALNSVGLSIAKNPDQYLERVGDVNGVRLVRDRF
jgi:hypothetical protein